MDPRSSNRQKVTTGNSKGVHRRGEGLGTGPVGRQDTYSGRISSGTGGRAAKIGGGSGTLIIIIIIIFMVMRGGGSGSSTNTGTGTSTSTGTGTSQSVSLTPSTGTSGVGSGASTTSFGDVTSLFGGFSGGQTTAGWQGGLNNTEKLNKEVSEKAREKRTQILGGGKDVITIMVYMCGTDLESRGGMASNDIREMAAANIPDNVNLILYTGGCTNWKTQGISTSTNQIYRVHSGKIEQLVDNDGDKVMTDPATLTGFIKYCSSNYPANRQFLIFWDHGGGTLSGYGYDEKHKSSGSMNLTMINKALSDAGQTFDFIGFDACLMATLETAILCDKYADYLIGSEETEPGVGWYYTKWLNDLASDTSAPTIQIGKSIVDGFVDECNRVCRGQKTTLSVIDLAEFSQTVPEKLIAFSKTSTDKLKGEYKSVADARAGSREFSTSSGIDQIDLVNFANSVGTNEGKELSETIMEAVKYNRTSSSMTNAYGVSIYFPRKRPNKVDTAASINSAIGVDNEYNQFMKAFAGLETSGQISAGGQGSAYGSLFGGSDSSATTSGADAIGVLLNAFLSGGRSVEGIDRDATQFMDDESAFNVDEAASYIADNQFDPSAMKWDTESDGTHTMTLTKDQWELIQSLQVNLFVDDGSGYVDMGLDNLYYFTEDGKLIGDTDNTWFSIDGQPVAFYYEDTTTVGEGENEDTIVQARVPAMVDGQKCNLIIIFDNEHPGGYIAGARYDYSDDLDEIGVDDVSDMTIAKGVTEIEEGAKIDFVCDYYDYDQVYQDSYKLGDQITYSKDLVLSYEDVKAPSKVTYLLTDIYNAEYWTPAIDQQ